MPTDEEDYNFNDSFDKYKARLQAQQEELRVKQMAELEQLVAKQKAEEEAMGPVMREALNERRAEQVKLMMANRKRRGTKTTSHLELEYMRACLCRI
jgi:hypothetical protein